MIIQKPSPSDPLYLALSRKLVLLLLLMVTTAIGLVALLLQIRLSILVLAFLLTDAVMGLVAGFSVRWILPKKALVLRICSTVAFSTGSLVLLGWFTGWGFGIDLLRAGHTGVGWWEIGQILLATGFALLALFAWQHPSRIVPPVTHTGTTKKMLHTRRKPQKRPNRAPKPRPASPATNLTIQPASQSIATQPAKPKWKRANHSKPKLLLSSQEEHRCPYCLELIDLNDRRGVVECEICHTLHHADCWAITGACQVPHFTP
jgi:hypothetical protein